MKNKLAALTLCFIQASAVSAFADDILRRPATDVEIEACKGGTFGDFHVIKISATDTGPRFDVLSCALKHVSDYSCVNLFKLANLSNKVRTIQDGVLNEAQALKEAGRYEQLGSVYDRNCNLSS